MREMRLLFVLFYVFVLAGSSFFHNDFACRQDSRTTCAACSVSQDAQKMDAHHAPAFDMRHAVGRVETQASTSVDAPALSSLSDRAPPVA